MDRHYMCSSSIKQTYAQGGTVRHLGERRGGALLAPLLDERVMCEGNQLTNKGIGYEFYYSGQARWHPRTI